MAAANEIQCSNSTVDNETVLPPDMVIWLYNEKIVSTRGPAMVFAGTLMLIGLIGNGFVLYAYGLKFRKTPANVYILWVGICDMICCTVLIPFEIFQLRFVVYLYTGAVTCKLLRGVSYLIYSIEGIILLCIAIDRYLKICRPLKIYRYSSPFYFICLSVCISVLLTWPASIINGIKTIYACIPGVYGKSCSIDDSVKDTIFPTLFYGILLGEFAIAFSILFVLYIKIVKAIRQWKNKDLQYSKKQVEMKTIGSGKLFENTSVRVRNMFRSQHGAYHVKKSDVSATRNPDGEIKLNKVSKCRRQNNNSYNGELMVDDTNEQSGDIHSNNSTLSTTFSLDSQCLTNSINNRDKGRITHTHRNTQSKLKERANLTKSVFIFTIVTICFVASYVPYLTCEILLKANIFNLKQQSVVVQMIIEIAEKSYCINNACNPIIYSIFNPEFRKVCVNLFKKT